jgi:hypothetical protein
LREYDVVLIKAEGDSHVGIVIGAGAEDVLHSWRPAGGVNLMRLERLYPVIEAAGRLKINDN